MLHSENGSLPCDLNFLLQRKSISSFLREVGGLKFVSMEIDELYRT